MTALILTNSLPTLLIQIEKFENTNHIHGFEAWSKAELESYLDQKKPQKLKKLKESKRAKKSEYLKTLNRYNKKQIIRERQTARQTKINNTPLPSEKFGFRTMYVHYPFDESSQQLLQITFTIYLFSYILFFIHSLLMIELCVEMSLRVC